MCEHELVQVKGSRIRGLSGCPGCTSFQQELDKNQVYNGKLRMEIQDLRRHVKILEAALASRRVNDYLAAHPEAAALIQKDRRN